MATSESYSIMAALDSDLGFHKGSLSSMCDFSRVLQGCPCYNYTRLVPKPYSKIGAHVLRSFAKGRLEIRGF